ncbi:hypothetical protein K438DRAFT_1972679 [Mycena galopus ATCC 62051]|nr:hypothetical protein K438DRAFT_1972679 [Mycena galopus ATCC 62051]
MPAIRTDRTRASSRFTPASTLPRDLHLMPPRDLDLLLPLAPLTDPDMSLLRTVDGDCIVGDWIDEERLRSAHHTAACNARLAVLADPTDKLKHLEYLRLFADFTELHGPFDFDTAEINAYISKKTLAEYDLDGLRCRAVKACPFRDPGTLQAYVSAAKKFLIDFGYSYDAEDSCDEIISEKHILRRLHKSLNRLEPDVQVQFTGRSLHIVEVRNPFPSYDNRCAVFDNALRQRMALFRGLPSDTLPASLDWPSVIVRLRNRFHKDPFSIEAQETYCTQRLWESQVMEMVERAKAEKEATPPPSRSPRDNEEPEEKSGRQGEEPTVFLSQGRTLIEKTGPAKSLSSVQEFPAVSSIWRDLDLGSSDLWDFEDDDTFTTPLCPVKGTESPTKKRHHATRVTQDQAWQLDVLPALIPVFVDLWHKTRGLRDADALQLLGRTDCFVAPLQSAKSRCDLEIDVPVAVDLRVLEFARTLFGKISPNNTAWTATMESFLTDLGFTLDHKGSLRRLFASTLEWYTHLRNLVSRHFDRVIEDARQSYLEEKQEEQRAHDDDGPATPTVSAPTPTQERPRGRESIDRFSPASTSPTPAPRAGQKRGREKTPPRENPFKPPPPLTRPSEYLRRRCPACFDALVHDGAVKMDFNVCLDACFTQKRNTGGNDPPKFHPDTFFVPEDLSRQMEEHVDSIRTAASEKKQRKATVTEVEDEDDIYEHKDLKLPRSVLDGCEASFKAADENRQKASSQFYSDTGLMALLCRHDRVLWLVNMHSPGEKQFNVWLLLETLMQHLPLDVVLGVMYDIACQAERSARKWGFLSRYIHRLLFAVSVFHAFGHEWACQVIYHPLKCEGFGFSNGESAERFWHLISHLIAHLRISGYHHRLYTLDNQVKQIDEANLFKLAEWIHRHTLFSKNKRAEAVRDLKKSGHSKEFLRQQWKEQVKSQTKPIPRRSKTRAEKAVAAVIELRNTVDARKKEVRECEAAWNDVVEDGDDELLADTELALKDARAAVTKLKDRLLRSENALGVDEKSELKKLTKTKFFQLRFDARVKKTRLRHLLRARKFEHERAERSSRRQQSSDIKLRTHTQSAVKRRQPKITNLVRESNNLCGAIQKEINKRTTPRGAIAPQPIDAKKVFELDVDDSIWQDVGLEDDDDRGEPPLWLSSDSVRSGIRVVLQLDRADKEDAMLAKETRSMRAWFIEEWDVLRLAVANAANEANRYQLFLRRERLLRLCATWRKHTRGNPGDAPWGPSQAELMECLAQAQTAGRGEDRYYEEDKEEEAFEMLDAMENADVYRDMYDSSSDED